MIITGLIAILSFIIVPVLVGFNIVKFFKNDNKSILFAYVIGYLIEFAICELISVPMIFLKCKFTTLLYTFIGINGILCLVSILINFKNIKEIILSNFKELKTTPKILTVLCIFLICVQIYVFAFYAHTDDDDAFYVSTSVTTVQTNSLFKYDPETGALEGENSKIRFIIGPFPLFMSIISGVLNIHPAIVAHLIFPVIILPVIYSLYYLLAKYFFKEDKNSTLLFLVFINILNMFGGYSKKANFAFLLMRIWQGKAMLANFIIPAIWLVFLNGKENGFKLVDYLLLVITIIAGNFTTSMGIGIPPIALILLVFAFEVSKFNFTNVKSKNDLKNRILEFDYKKSFINILKCVVCCFPSIICGLIYILY